MMIKFWIEYLKNSVLESNFSRFFSHGIFIENKCFREEPQKIVET